MDKSPLCIGWLITKWNPIPWHLAPRVCMSVGCTEIPCNHERPTTSLFIGSVVYFTLQSDFWYHGLCFCFSCSKENTVWVVKGFFKWLEACKWFYPCDCSFLSLASWNLRLPLCCIYRRVGVRVFLLLSLVHSIWVNVSSRLQFLLVHRYTFTLLEFLLSTIYQVRVLIN